MAIEHTDGWIGRQVAAAREDEKTLPEFMKRSMAADQENLESWTKEQLIAEIRRMRFADPNAQDWKKMLDDETAANVKRRAELESKLHFADHELKQAREATKAAHKCIERLHARKEEVEDALLETIKTVNELIRRGEGNGE